MRSIVFYICGLIITGFGLLMTIPGFVDMYYGNTAVALNTFMGSIISITSGGLLFLTFHNNIDKIKKGEIFLITSSIWLVVSAFCALPFYFNVAEFNYVSAYFEAISSLTTTGITSTSSVDVLSQGLLIWRSLLQWIGGVGIVVMAIAILPILRVGGMQLFYTESSDKLSKAAPSMRTIIYRICSIYLFFTVVFTLLLWIVEMNFFDAINFSFASISTAGGNVTHNDAVGYFKNPLTYWLLTFEMIIGALPFVFLFYSLTGNKTEMLRNGQVRYYLTYLFVFWVFLSSYIWIGSDENLFMIMTEMAFYIASFATTTGITMGDYTLFGSLVVGILFVMTFVGGCTGSTAGGLKIFRFQVVIMTIKKYLGNMFHPHQVILVKYNDKKIDDDIITGVFVFISVFIMTVIVLSLAMIATGIPVATAFMSVMTCAVNNGFGFGELMGDYGSFGNFPAINKIILSLTMMLGRLEFLTALVLLSPKVWKNS